MNPVSKAELARLASVSRAAVTGKIKRGALPALQDGTVDLDDTRIREYIEKANYPRGGLRPGRSARRRPEKTAQEKKPEKKKAVKSPTKKNEPSKTESMPAPPKKKTTLYPENDDADFSGVSADDPLPEVPGYTGTENLNSFHGNELADIERREKIRKLQIANKKAESEVIERDEVKSIMSAIDAIINSQMRPLGTSLAPELASVAGASDPATEIEITRLVDEAIERLLGNIRREFREWVSAPEPEKPKKRRSRKK
jgi:hypothetical protein